MDDKADSRKMIGALTGARFFAALAVILVHSLRLGLQGKDSGMLQMANNAVAFFFVLSGFILTYVYSDKLNWRSIPNYYWARWARIWPLHLVCLLAAIAVLAWQSKVAFNNQTLVQILASLTLVQSWLPGPNWWTKFNGPSWSISTELGFYLAFPFLLLMGRKRFWPIAIGAVLVVGLFVGLANHWTNQDPKWANVGLSLIYVNPISRILDFIIGIWIGRWFLKSKPVERSHGFGQSTVFECVALATIALMYFVISKDGFVYQWMVANQFRLVGEWLWNGGFMAPAFAFLIWVLAWSKGALARFLSRPFMVFLGEISFAFYMIQNVVIQAITPCTTQLDLAPGVVVLIVIGVSFGLAALLYMAIEVPCRSALRNFAGSEFKKGFSEFRAIPARLVRSGFCFIALIVFLASAGFLMLEINQQTAELGRAARVLETSLADSGFSRVTFSDEAVLVAYEYKVHANRLQITLYWKRMATSQRKRFVHFFDEQGKIVQQLTPLRLYAYGSDSMVRDKIEVRLSELPQHCKLGIGFHSGELGTTPADRGERSMAGRRLDLLEKLGEEIRTVREE